MAQNNNVTPIDNTDNFFSDFFSFRGRIRRRVYVVSMIVLYILNSALETAACTGYGEFGKEYAGWYYIALVILLIPAVLVGTKRCHDLGTSGWFQLIPFYGLILAFGSGDHGINKYGSNPKEDYDEQLEEYEKSLNKSDDVEEISSDHQEE